MIIYFNIIIPVIPIMQMEIEALVYAIKAENDTEGHQRRPSRKWV